jgi:hypothetical protein
MFIYFQKCWGGGGADPWLDSTLQYMKFLRSTMGKSRKDRSITEIFKGESVIQTLLIKQEEKQLQ